jgi:hypothetical protein
MAIRLSESAHAPEGTRLSPGDLRVGDLVVHVVDASDRDTSP